MSLRYQGSSRRSATASPCSIASRKYLNRSAERLLQRVLIHVMCSLRPPAALRFLGHISEEGEEGAAGSPVSETEQPLSVDGAAAQHVVRKPSADAISSREEAFEILLAVARYFKGEPHFSHFAVSRNIGAAWAHGVFRPSGRCCRMPSAAGGADGRRNQEHRFKLSQNNLWPIRASPIH